MTDRGLQRQIMIVGYLHIGLGAVLAIIATINLIEAHIYKPPGWVLIELGSKPLILLGLTELVVGIGFVSRRLAAWFLLWPVLILLLPRIPVGTGIALYSFWVLLSTRKLWFVPSENLPEE